MVRYCEKCGKHLVSIGTSRENGKRTHDDWSKRNLHKKCWVEEQKEKERKNYLLLLGGSTYRAYPLTF